MHGEFRKSALYRFLVQTPVVAIIIITIMCIILYFLFQDSAMGNLFAMPEKA